MQKVKLASSVRPHLHQIIVAAKSLCSPYYFHESTPFRLWLHKPQRVKKKKRWFFAVKLRQSQLLENYNLTYLRGLPQRMIWSETASTHQI